MRRHLELALRTRGMDRRQAVCLCAVALSLGVPLSVAKAAAQSFSEFMALDEVGLGQWIGAQTPAQQAAYVRAIAAYGSRVADYPLPKLFPMGPGAPGMEIAPIGRNKLFAVIAYAAAPGAKLPPHNHPNYSVATIGLEGEVVVGQFEPDGPTPEFASTERFQVRKTAERVLRRGDAVTLAPASDNIHTFTAEAKGARWIDITTPHEPDIGFSYLSLTDTRGQVGDRLEARWKPSS